MIDYKLTLNLPKTNFPMRANLKKIELEILKNWYKNNIYEVIRQAKKNKKKFLLYDGPPYANGDIHVGHAFNKVLKDIILKSKSLSGFDTPYIPGWDCHGLPIEHRIEKKIGYPNNKTDANNFRIQCRKYVLNQIKIQKKDFIRLGIIGDWDNSYLTMDFNTEANIVRSLAKLLKKGYLYRGLKPVYWCFDCKSALAEAEIEYQEKKSLSAYILFNVSKKYLLNKLFNFSKEKNCTISLLIWTTTPWTIPANCAVAVNQKYQYQLIKVKKNKYIIIAEKLVDKVIKEIKINYYHKLNVFSGKLLSEIKCQHPFLQKEVPIVISNHVNYESGTGIVHIAPGHGPDDYLLSQKYKLPIINLINSKGIFLNDEFPQFNGIHILKLNNLIIENLQQKKILIKSDEIIHSYPHCWRHKTSVIFRTTPQWFISMDKNKLRKQTLKIIKNVDWIPHWGMDRMKYMLMNRPDWCISRQRIWGVPITLFIHKETGELHEKTLDIMEKAARKIEKYGSDCWWNLENKDFLDSQEEKNYSKVLDTLDVWFDSGSIHDSIMKKNYADLYLEGSDQHRGWFMSSLIISSAINKQAPYRQVLTHGFTVDKNKKKMSKSLLNNINPINIIEKYGADIFRLWVASTDYSNEITVCEKNFIYSSNIYRRIRNTLRFLLANLNNFNPDHDILKKEKMILIDQWAVGKTKTTQEHIIKCYNNYKFHDVIKTIVHFCSIDMGSFYLDIIKDRKYTTKINNIPYLSVQTTIWYILQSLMRWLIPIIPFTIEEIWQFIPGKKNKHMLTAEWFQFLFELNDNQPMNNKFWNLIRHIKNQVNSKIEKAREKKIIKNSLEIELTIKISNDSILNKLVMLGDELKFIFLTSKVELLKNKVLKKENKKDDVLNNIKINIKKSQGIKCPRCWHYFYIDNNQLQKICYRCISNTLGEGEKRKFV